MLVGYAHNSVCIQPCAVDGSVNGCSVDDNSCSMLRAYVHGAQPPSEQGMTAISLLKVCKIELKYNVYLSIRSSMGYLVRWPPQRLNMQNMIQQR